MLKVNIFGPALDTGDPELNKAHAVLKPPRNPRGRCVPMCMHMPVGARVCAESILTILQPQKAYLRISRSKCKACISNKPTGNADEADPGPLCIAKDSEPL